jgi:hypothetical protein
MPEYNPFASDTGYEMPKNELATAGAASLMTMNPLPIVLTLFGSVLQSMTYKRPSLQLTPEQQTYEATVNNYRKISARREAAASIASAFSGKSKESFYGREGFKARYTPEVIEGVQNEGKKEFVQARVKEMASKIGWNPKKFVESKIGQAKAMEKVNYGRER